MPTQAMVHAIPLPVLLCRHTKKRFLCTLNEQKQPYMFLILETLSCVSPSEILQQIVDCSVRVNVLLIVGVLDLRASSSGSRANVSSLADIS